MLKLGCSQERVYLFAFVILLALSGCADFFTDTYKTPPKQVIDDLPLDLVRLPTNAGWFTMGSDDDALSEGKPATKVLLSYSFAMQRTEVSRAEFFQRLGYKPWRDQTVPIDSTLADSSLVPVTGLSWYDAILFCNARSKVEGLDTVYEYGSIVLNASGDVVQISGINVKWDVDGYRLPTEAEWVFAARSGGDSKMIANSDSTSSSIERGHLVSVNDLPANSYGLKGMAGNAMEWIQDWLAPYPGGEVLDPLGASQAGALEEKVVKGGSYAHGERFFRLETRKDWYSTTPSTRTPYLGFRVVRGALPKESGYWSDRPTGAIANAVVQNSRAGVLAFLAASRAKLLFTDDAGSGLAMVNFAQTNPQVQFFPDSAPVFHPVLSPDGEWIAYATRFEGQGGESRIRIRSAQRSDTRIITLADSLAFIPRWWVSPTTLDTFVIYASSAKANRDSLEWSTQRTYRQKISAGQPVGDPVDLGVPGAFHSGVSLDGDLLVSGYTDLRTYHKSTQATNTWFQSPSNGKPVGASTQVCNASVSPDSTPKILFIDFGSTDASVHNDGKPYGVHELLFIADGRDGSILSTIKAPSKQAGFDHPEWSNSSEYAVAVGFDSLGNRGYIQAINVSTDSVYDLVRGENLAYPSLWIKPQITLAGIDVSRAFQYTTPIVSAVTSIWAAKMQYWWPQHKLWNWFVLGSSRPMAGFDGSSWNHGKLFNLAVSGAGPHYAYKMIDSYLDIHSDIDGLIVGVDVDRLCHDTIWWEREIEVTEGFRYDNEKSFWNNGLPLGVEKIWENIPPANEPSVLYDGTWVSFPEGWGPANPPLEKEPCWGNPRDIHWSALEQLESIAVYAEANSITLVLAILPMHPGYTRSTQFGRYGPPNLDTADSIVKRLREIDVKFDNTTFIDFHQNGKHSFPFDAFKNHDHLSQIGAAMLTTQLADSLLARGLLQD